MPRPSVVAGTSPGVPAGAAWVLRGVASNLRYAVADAVAALRVREAPVARLRAVAEWTYVERRMDRPLCRTAA